MKSLLFLLTLFLLTVNCFAQDTIVDYLNTVKRDFRTESHLLSDDVINDYNIVFIGEAHGFRDSYEVAYKLIKEYKERTDFTYLLGETDLAVARLMNTYLLNEDSTSFKELVASAKSLASWSKENYEFYKQMIELNKAQINKIQYMGIDIPAGGVDFTAQRLVSIMNKYNETDSVIQSLIDVKIPSKQAITYVKKLLKDPNQKAYAAEDLFEYNYHLNNMVHYYSAVQAESDLGWDQIRDSCMYENYLKLEKQYALQDQKMIGVWGYEHTFQDTSLGVNYLASRLSSMANKNVYTYRLFYFNSISLIPENWLPWYLKLFRAKKKLYYTTKLFNDDIHVTGYKPKADVLRELSPEHSITIYNLTAEGSPFTYKPLLVASYHSNFNTTDYFQTAIVIRDSEPVEPFGENRR